MNKPSKTSNEELKSSKIDIGGRQQVGFFVYLGFLLAQSTIMSLDFKYAYILQTVTLVIFSYGIKAYVENVYNSHEKKD